MQTEMPFAPSAVTDEAVENLRLWMERHLDEQRGWLTGARLSEAVGRIVGEREIRRAASLSEDIISGQKGYRHIRHSTQEEIQHAAAWLESQAKTMSDRACRIRRRAHQLIA